jgi:hypothetical protein
MMKSHRNDFRRAGYSWFRAIALVVTATLAVASVTAAAQASDKIVANYEVKVNGVTMLEIKYGAEISSSGYQTRASIDTAGVASIYSGYQAKMEASGAFEGAVAAPQSYRSTADKNDKKKRIELHWSDGVVPQQVNRTNRNPEIQADVDNALKPGAVDVLTAILKLGANSGNGACNSSQRIFDGDDVYDLRFGPAKKVTIDHDQQGVYQGAAYQCQMSYRPVAGRAAIKFKKKNSDPQVFSVWFASIKSDALGQAVMLPVLATGELGGWKFAAYADRFRIDGQSINEASGTGD